MLKTMTVDGGKGSASFKKAQSKGIVQVKYDGDVQKVGGAMVTLQISFNGGDSTSDLFGLRTSSQEVLIHDFLQCRVCGLPKEVEEWDFARFVDGSQTFSVCLDIISVVASDECKQPMHILGTARL